MQLIAIDRIFFFQLFPRFFSQIKYEIFTDSRSRIIIDYVRSQTSLLEIQLCTRKVGFVQTLNRETQRNRYS